MSTANVDNGVNVEHLLGARQALSEAPEAAQFTWKATNEWLNGTHSRSSVDSYHGLGEEHQHRSTFTFEADHPLVFGAEDNAATPVELVLAGLASCLTAGVAAVAQNREIQLRSVKATLEGSMDILGILGGDPDVRNGFNDVKVSYDIDADATPDESQGAGCPVPEAVGRLRHHHQPDERDRRGRLRDSSGPTTAGP